jgi:hypothetical protein
MTDELPLVDRVVDAVVAGAPAASRLALRYFHDASTDPWSLDEIDSGGFVPWDELNMWLEKAMGEGCKGLKLLVTAERYAEILDDAPLTAEEERQTLHAVLFDYFEAPIEGWVYRLLAVPDSAGRQVVASVISEGSSWEGVRVVLMGMHRSQADAIAALKRYGLISAEDLGQASPRKRRLSEPQLKARTREF